LLLQLGPFFNMHLIRHAVCRQQCFLRIFWLYLKNSMQSEMLLTNFLTICEKQHADCNAENNTFIHFCTYPFKKFGNLKLSLLKHFKQLQIYWSRPISIMGKLARAVHFLKISLYFSKYCICTYAPVLPFSTHL